VSIDAHHNALVKACEARPEYQAVKDTMTPNQYWNTLRWEEWQKLCDEASKHLEQETLS
jgi:hypothetical protein